MMVLGGEMVLGAERGKLPSSINSGIFLELSMETFNGNFQNFIKLTQYFNAIFALAKQPLGGECVQNFKELCFVQLQSGHQIIVFVIITLDRAFTNKLFLMLNPLPHPPPLFATWGRLLKKYSCLTVGCFVLNPSVLKTH